MKKLTKIAAPLALVVLLATGGVSACTADENPTPETTTAGTSTQDVTSAPANIVFGRVALINNADTRETPVAASLAVAPWFRTSNEGSIVFMSSDTSLPGGNGRNQIYRWTPEFGVMLVTNVGIDPATPVGANGHSWLFDMNDDGDIVIMSDAPDLPGGTGQDQIYLGTATGELTPVFIAGHHWNPSAQDIRRDPFWPYYPKINNDGSIVFRDFPNGDIEVNNYLIYRWTATDGVTLICDVNIHDPVIGDDYVLTPEINSSGSFVFQSTSFDLPGGNGKAQIYIWTSTDGITLVTNIGTLTAPVGGDAPSFYQTEVGSELGDDGSLLFTSQALGFPGGNGLYQVYLWTPSDGVTLVSNAGTAQDPIGANDYSWHRRNSQGSVVFTSRATDLPGSNGIDQLYLWTPSDGITLITNAGTTRTPVGVDGQIHQASINNRKSVAFSTGATNLPCGESGQQMHLWTTESGLIPMTYAGTADAPICADWERVTHLEIRNDDSVVFVSNAPDLPGAATESWGLYVWTPLR